MASTSRSVGYAVVGLGWISQAAVLPAFANVPAGARLAALVSGDEGKRRRLARHYGLDDAATFDYDAYDACLDRDDVDAVYIAVPNHLHREYAVRAAEKGVHVLCEKPMAPSAADCRAMIVACRDGGVRLMIAYRLHLEPAHMRAAELVRQGAIGEPRVFDATFTQQVEQGDIRLAPTARGGGPLFDIGIYCINAARYLFRAEPHRVRAAAGRLSGDPRFRETDAVVSALLEFPGDRHAAFTCSFAAAGSSAFRLVGSEGQLEMGANAFNFQGDRELRVAGSDGETRTEAFPTSDQFGPQLAYFSDCILDQRPPAPDGEEGWRDVMIIDALHRAADSGEAVALDLPPAARYPDPGLAVRFPAVEEPELVGADAPDE